MNQLQLSLVNLSCERDERLLFAKLNAEFVSGDIVQIAGANGAGKTTLMRIISGLSSEYDGDVLWCGKPAKGYDFLSHLLFHGHSSAVNPSLTPLENLAWYFGLNGLKSSKGGEPGQKQFEQALEHVGLKGYGDIPCLHMSAGQQRRVALARLYISRAPLWILDEPYTAIDKLGVENLEKRIKEHALGGGLVLLTTHQASNLGKVKVLNLSDYKVDA